MAKPIVVGYDGSEASERALEWAALESRSRAEGLRIVVAWHLPPIEFVTGQDTFIDPTVVDSERDYGQQILQQGLAAAERLDATDVTGVVVGDSPAHALIRAAQEADLIVVGSRGLGGFTGVLLGGVSRQVATHAHCPTVVVREPADPDSREVVVGVDGSKPALRALDFAFDQASRHAYSLRVLHTWDVPPVGAVTGVPTFSPPELIEDLKGTEIRTTAEVLAGHRERYPDVEVIQDVRQGAPVRTLTEASQRAAMLVVGSRGRGGFLGLLLGSVSHGVAHHAHCTVAVVR